MKITLNNYAQMSNQIDFSALPPALQEGHDFLQSLLAMPDYQDALVDEELKSVVVLYLEKLNASIGGGGSTPPVKRKVVATKGRKINTRKRTTPAAKTSMKAKFPTLYKGKKTVKPKAIKPSKPKYKVGQSVIVDGWVYKIANIKELSTGEYQYFEDEDANGKTASFYQSEIQKAIPAAKYYAGQVVMVNGESHKIKGFPMWGEGEGEKDDYMYSDTNNDTFYQYEITGIAKTTGSKSRPGTGVSRISPEIKFIKRFVNLEGDTKTKGQILNFIKDLQKAIAEKQISKTSKFGSEIMDIQNTLIRIYEVMPESIEIKTKDDAGLQKMAKLQAIADGEVVYWSVYYAKRIISLRGNETKDKATKLKKEIDKKLESDKSFAKEGTVYTNIFLPMYDQLRTYLSDSSKIQVKESVLYGLDNMPPILAYTYKDKRYELSLTEKKKGLGNVISSDELRNQHYDKIGLTGELRELLGDMTKGAHLMIKGREKMGKSTLALILARDLAKSYGNVLYVSCEEFGSPTLKDRADRLKAYHSRLSYAQNIPPNPGHYDFVFIDSFTKAGLNTNDIEKFRTAYPQSTFFYIFRTTKTGEARGTAENAFEVDAIIDVADGIASNKGRFGGGTMKIF